MLYIVDILVGVTHEYFCKYHLECDKLNHMHHGYNAGVLLYFGREPGHK